MLGPDGHHWKSNPYRAAFCGFCGKQLDYVREWGTRYFCDEACIRAHETGFAEQVTARG